MTQRWVKTHHRAFKKFRAEGFSVYEASEKANVIANKGYTDMAAILPLLLQLLAMTPQLVSTGKEVVEGVQKIWDGISAEHPPTAAEQQQYDAALLAAHTALQNS